MIRFDCLSQQAKIMNGQQQQQEGSWADFVEGSWADFVERIFP
jgi:hypothetical protein